MMIIHAFIKNFHFVRKGLLLFVTSLFLSTLFAQKNPGTVTGIATNSTTHQPVTNASISVVNEKDSMVRAFAVTSDKGIFGIKSLPVGNYIILISYEGLETVNRRFSISTHQKNIDLGVINMKEIYKILQEVVVNSTAPIKVRGDTVAYDANAFKTKPNATVEDLLKKLPGVQVDRDGNIKAQGEEVQRVYVNGKEFFGSNPQMATQNLTADMVDQVQIYNDKSEQAKFNGIDDGSSFRTINLKLKKDKTSGIFGKVYGGYGTNSRYNDGLNIHYFKDALQLSLIAGTNNINNTGYSFSNISKVTNNESAGIGSNRNGITKTSLLGLNYRDVWNKNFDVTTSYIFNHANTNNLRESSKRTFLTDSNLLTNQYSIYNNIIDNHTWNAKIVYSIDTFNSIIYRGSFNAQNSYSFNNDTITDFVEKNENRYKADDNRTINSNTNEGSTWTNNLAWLRKFNKMGRTFSLNLSHASFSVGRTRSTAISSRFYTGTGFVYREINSNYKTYSDNQTNNYTLALSYTEPIDANKFLELHINHYNNRNTSDIKTYNYNDITKQYDKSIDSLTNNFDNVNTYNRVGTNFKLVNKKYSYQLGLSLQQTFLLNNNLREKKNIAQHYINILPAASLNYYFSKNKNLQINYQGRSSSPAISQLQDVTDISSYPYIRKGNPSLKQEFNNSLMLTYNSFDIKTLKNFFVFINYNSSSNKIVNSIEQKAGEQTVMPVNCNGIFNISGTINFGLPLKKMESKNLNTTTDIDYSRNANIINGHKNYIKNLLLSEEISLNYNYKEKLDLSANASINYNSINYTIQKDQNVSFFTKNFSIDATYTFSNGLMLSTTANFTFYNEISTNYNQHYVLWNASLSKQLFKNNRGELKLSLNDILNNNLNLSRNVYDNYVENTKNTVLKRYGLITFTYNLNNKMHSN